jgi:hypothetical protein
MHGATHIKEMKSCCWHTKVMKSHCSFSGVIWTQRYQEHKTCTTISRSSLTFRVKVRSASSSSLWHVPFPADLHATLNVWWIFVSCVTWETSKSEPKKKKVYTTMWRWSQSFSVHVMKAYVGNRSTAPLIRKFCTRWSWVVNLAYRLLYLPLRIVTPRIRC